MKKYSAIKEMFYGNRGVNETIKFDKDDVIFLDAITKNEELLLKRLDSMPDALEIYKKLDNAISEYYLLESERYYVEGFKFGFLMAMDVFNI